ncbi:PREDICTED: uncharacterized protein LOC109236049 [Nicotiana attenuata]|uniref:uncharacterized protein LOC109236049 n=1 Tax=Nicotiana attenuata TaxID=49451 RepID=UPI0009049D52|nr:PREDICTED: uncharacterized protein LOC109236049 [Nicotiana attenuata]
MKEGPTLTQQQQEEPIAEVTYQEIDQALKGIGGDKAPGIDGYSAEFFKKAWLITKEEVYAAVKDFFHTGKMFQAINCTTLTLIPKVANPVTIKDFRPIACCTVLYKLISKVIAGRLQKVMPHIISEAQAGFIPGRKIADNIILAHELVESYNRKQISPRCMLKVDMMKAYDSVEWVYLDQLLEYLCFPTKFNNWANLIGTELMGRISLLEKKARKSDKTVLEAERQKWTLTSELAGAKASPSKAEKDKERLECSFSEQLSKSSEEIRELKALLAKKEEYAGELVQNLTQVQANLNISSDKVRALESSHASLEASLDSSLAENQVLKNDLAMWEKEYELLEENFNIEIALVHQHDIQEQEYLHEIDVVNFEGKEPR